MAAILALASPAGAEIYTWTDADGQRHISNIKPTHIENPDRIHVQEKFAPPATYNPPARAPAPQKAPPQTHYIGEQPSNYSLEHCKNIKQQAIQAEKRRKLKGAREMNSWLWKNCRKYSNELRKLSQQAM
jgi:hypothetical protein